MLLLLNHNGARRSNSYQQALSAQSTPPRKHQLPLDHKLTTGSYTKHGYKLFIYYHHFREEKNIEKQKESSAGQVNKLEDVNFAAYVLQEHIAEQISVQNADREINQKVHWGCTGCCDLRRNLSTF